MDDTLTLIRQIDQWDTEVIAVLIEGLKLDPAGCVSHPRVAI